MLNNYIWIKNKGTKTIYLLSNEVRESNKKFVPCQFNKKLRSLRKGIKT